MRSDGGSSESSTGAGCRLDAPHLVPDPVDHRLPQVGLHRAHVPGLEAVQPSKHVQNGFLHEIAGVERTAGRHRQPAVCPSPERREAALEERLDGEAIAFAGADDQFDGGLVAEERVSAFGAGGLGWRHVPAGARSVSGLAEIIYLLPFAVY